MQVTLASTSPARLALLRQAGIEPRLRAPDVDEEAVIAETERDEARTLPPDEHVLLLARRKAQDVAARLPSDEDAIVIGGDSMFELDGRVLGKPYEPDAARARWRDMRGRTGVLHSGMSVIRVGTGAEAHATQAASVTFAADISDDEIDAYVATSEPLLLAGAFAIDGRAAAFIEHIEGAPSTVIGMSLPMLRRLTGELDVPWTELWNLPW
ncbi:MAG: nucleoside triphosphate pyrophosphatase [Microbacterium sp.]